MSALLAPMPDVAPPPLAASATPVVRVRDLRKAYDGTPVLRGVSLALQPGRVLGVLGANGAGKTTLLETIEGLRTIEHGSVEVLGRDMRTDYKAVQRELGIQLQRTSFFRTLTVRETLRLYGTLYDRREEAKHALARFGLEGAARTLVGRLSGGQFQRFSLCVATLNAPRVLFLDEPTTGLDPRARRALWQTVGELGARGTAILLTTHHMDEVESVCDDVVVLRGGVIVARGTPRELAAAMSAECTVVVSPGAGETVERVAALVPDGGAAVHEGAVYVKTPDAGALVDHVLRAAAAAGVRLGGLSVREPSLEDAFLALTAPNDVSREAFHA